MSTALRAVACGAVLAGAAGACLGQALPDGAAQCRAAIDAQRYADRPERSEPLRLGEVCGDFAAALADDPWGEALAKTQPDELTAAAFIALTKVANSYAQPATRSVDVAALDAALRSVATQVAPPELSLWQRAMRWLQERLGRSEPGEEARGWLDKWLSGISLPERWTRYLLAGLGVFAIVATALIVWNELRAAAVFGRRRALLGAANGSIDQPTAALRAHSLADVRAAPFARQPALLLVLVLRRVARRRRSPWREPDASRARAAAAG